MERKEKFAPGEYYHIYNRTILNVPEFTDYENSARLAQAFLLANSSESSKAFNYIRTYNNASWKKSVEIAWRGDKLVDIVCYAIMPNHYHLLLQELEKGGITEFVRKCNTSIAKYINIKKERKGPLFESRFQAKHIDSNEYLLHLSLYIHLNPLDFLDSKNWRKGHLKNWETKRKSLLKYPWSSLKSFVYKNFEDPILSGTNIILGQFRNKNEYEKFLKEWSENDMQKIENLVPTMSGVV